ncbi:MAG TPA: DUF2752 domain-containing protein [Nocardioidaceae bacterium]|nr:DUF2752 domain-containing protein [Nocardioidaceae bacterium]
MTSTTRRNRDRRTIVGFATLGVVGLAVLALRDPHVSGSYGFCPFRALTGLWCPLCGGLRATHDLTQLRFADAVSSNLLAVVIVLAGIAYFCYWAAKRWRARATATIRVGPRGLAVIAAVAVSFTVLRNLAFGSALAP